MKRPELDADLIHQIAMKVQEEWLAPKIVARGLCVPYRTFGGWMKVGEDLQNEGIEPDPDSHEYLCLRLVVAVEIAEADCERELVRRLRESRPSEANKWMTILERRFPARWAKSDQKNLGKQIAESPDEFFRRMASSEASTPTKP